MPTPSHFTALIQALLDTARVAFDRSQLVRFIRRHWPAIQLPPSTSKIS